MSVSELADRGVRVEPYAGPAIWLPWKRWLGAIFVLVIGVVAYERLNQVRGGSGSGWWIAPAVFLGLAIVTSVAGAFRVLRLRQRRRDGEPVLGWCLGRMNRFARTRGRSSSGVNSSVLTLVTGVLVDDRGLYIIVDQADVGVVRDSDGLELSIGYRGSRRWLCLREGDKRAALRVWPI